MAIRLVNGCVNCENLTAENVCKLHQTKVETKHTCDNFNMRPSLQGATHLHVPTNHMLLKECSATNGLLKQTRKRK